MSGHNPHSRVSQPVNSSSWNHLQVPSYMPRQPQLAHMSSERTLRSSPLIWPNTNPADAFYNYMALTAAAAVANSNPKNTTLDMNPLLPFVRTQANSYVHQQIHTYPNESNDLNLPAAASTVTPHANRNSLTPSPRNPVSPNGSASSSSNNRFVKSTGDGQDDGKIDENNSHTDPIAFLNEMSEQLASMRTNRNIPLPSTIPRDTTNNLNSDLSNFRINGGNEKSKQRTEPMEIGREPNTAANLFENESLPNSVHLQQLLGLTSSVSSNITPNLNDLSKSLLSIFNNTSSASQMLISPKSHSNFHSRQIDTNVSKNCLNTSNDDSLDSQSGACNGDDGNIKQQNKRYRRRKPQKTVRMSNELNASESANMLVNEKHQTVKNSDCHNNTNDNTNNSNGINCPSYHSEANSILPSGNTSVLVQAVTLQPPPIPPQTQSIDLSHHCENHEMFENGLVNYSKANDINVSNSTVGVERSDKDSNLMQNDEINGLNLFGAVNFGHLRGANLTHDIATFPNTDDLVKKVEELVKCNEQNGFVNDSFGSMESAKTHTTNKLVSEGYDTNRIANGMPEAIKSTNNSIEHANIHLNTIKCNGNGIIPTIISTSNDKIENKNHKDIGADEVDIPTSATELTTVSENLEQNDKMNESSTNPNLVETYGATNSIDMMCNKLSDDTKQQSNNADTSSASVKPNDTANNNTLNNDSTNRFNSNTETVKCSLSTSCSESPPSNSSITPKKKTVTKKKTANQRCNGKINGKQNANNKTNNQKNAKTNDKSEKKGDIKKTKSKDDSTADALNKFRGPYVHVERDGSIDVINAPLNEEIAEKQSKFKKNYISQRPADRNKVRGLHVSTLSNKYDAVTTDISWMCVFCKLGPHKYGLGDLFGPFILSTESEDFQLAQIDPKNDIFKSSTLLLHRHKGNMSFTENISVVAAKSLSKCVNAGNATVKKKRKLNQLDNGTTSNICAMTVNRNAQTSEIDIFHGMTQASESSYEAWAHEDCIVWASGVHIIGARVVGLETAVWGSVRHQCSLCKQYGAMLSCLQRNCTNEVHVPCAKRCDWNLNENTFQSRCSEHSPHIDTDTDTDTNVDKDNNQRQNTEKSH